eukprot:TRINITY_DN14294_c0_g4_i1.p1 TRINITY_DN14294_c0_g4~~TRINITY_DN14294_c0_g4_i1.p1  ORF type:complete len:178 (+),score=27.11 TRINITY_DN14294_c0_g4_i1:47-580(+)
MAGAAAWRELKRLRHRDLLRGTLLRSFERDQMESRVLQSDAFRPLLTRWADVLLDRGSSGLAATPQEVPTEVQEQARTSGNAEVRWLVRRLLSGDMQWRGTPKFPSTLLERGPQYPFQPAELNYLKSRIGCIRGTEMTQRLKRPKQAERIEEPPVRDLWAEGCYDDGDFLDHTKPPR